MSNHSFLEIKELISYLDQLDARTKVRIVFKDYGLWRDFLPFYQKYKDKFILFKDKKEFIMNDNLVETKKENIPLKESLIKWMKQNKMPKEIKDILLGELK